MKINTNIKKLKQDTYKDFGIDIAKKTASFERRSGEKLYNLKHNHYDTCVANKMASILRDNKFQDTSYSETLSQELNLKERLAEHLINKYSVSVQPHQILFTYGDEHNIFLMQLVNKFGFLSYFSPCERKVWLNMSELTCNKLSEIPLVYHNGSAEWSIDWTKFKKQVLISDMLYLSNPHSPTGKVFTPEEIEKMSDYCHKNDIMLVVNSTYESILWSDYINPIVLKNKWLVNLYSFNNMFATNSCKSGFIIVRDNKLCELLDRTIKTHCEITNSYLNKVFVELLCDTNTSIKIINSLNKEMQERSEIMHKELSKHFDGVVKPGGTPYLFVNMKNHFTREHVMVKELIIGGVAVDFGSDFGKKWDRWIRISCSDIHKENIKDAVDRIVSRCKK